eukprot:TRINITY_DN16310_c0_g1_i1.p1 TRINITY_DN16310_c0_g1~~TRINITY_DN16310_c0_g1_i1.p1  ORF type:complete len:895 (+),score=170.51 TRINITY_DN16310_c0_g1_i1:57-2741(+)
MFSGDAEPLSPGYFTIPNAILLSCSVVVVALPAAYVLLRAASRAVPLPAGLLAVTVTAVIVSSVSTWGVVYSAGLDAVNTVAKNLLVHAGTAAVQSVESDVAAGALAMETLWDLVQDSDVDILHLGYPHTHKLLSRLGRLCSGGPPVLEALYIGNRLGSTQGVARGGRRGTLNLWVGSPPAAPNGGTLDVYPVAAAVSHWDVPNASAPGFCVPTNAANGAAVGSTTVAGKPGRFWLAGNDDTCSFAYDPRLQPFYSEAPEALWLAAAHDVPLHNVPVVTLAKGVRGAAGWDGVVAADFSPGRLSEHLAPPSAHGITVLCNAAGDVLAASDRTLAVPTNVHSPDWRRADVRSAFSELSGAALGLETESEARILQVGGSAVLDQPARLLGGRLHMLVVIPHRDLVSQYLVHATYALAASLAFTCACGVLLVGATRVLLGPVDEICTRIEHMARLKVSEKPWPRTWLAELGKLTDALAHLSVAMASFREFVPDTVLSPTAALLSSTQGTVFEGPGGFSESICSAQSSFIASRRDHPALNNPALAVWLTDTTSTNLSELVNSARRSPMSRNGSPLVLSTSSRMSTTSHSNVQRVCSVLVCNTRKWLSLLSSQEKRGLEANEAYLWSVVTLVRGLRGVAEGFNGDRFCASFNSTKTVSQHALFAARAALSINASQKRGFCANLSQKDLEINVAVGTGTLLCGPIGCQTLRKVGTSGPVLALVYILERLSARWDLPNVCSDQTVSECAMHVNCRIVAKVVHSKSRSGPVKVWELQHGEKEVPEQEWMYQMEAAEAENLYFHYNRIGLAILDGDDAAAANFAERAPATAVGVAHLRALLKTQCAAKPTVHVLDELGGLPNCAPLRLPDLPEGSMHAPAVERSDDCAVSTGPTLFAPVQAPL